MVVLRLEPFGEDQINQWSAWNRANTDESVRRRLQPLPLQTVLDYAELAAQPLLLTMLALFDANANQLQHLGVSLIMPTDMTGCVSDWIAAKEPDGAVLAADELNGAINVSYNASRWRRLRCSIAGCNGSLRQTSTQT